MTMKIETGNLTYDHNFYHSRHNYRTRLVGLAVLDGVVSSEALFNASPCFKDQVENIVPAILVTFYQAECSVLEHELVPLCVAVISSHVFFPELPS
jgi:hypothetical protein